MFGGFDGDFYNDMHILNVQKNSNSFIKVSESTIDQDYLKMLDNEEYSDMDFVLNTKPYKSKVNVNKSLMLFRTVERELEFQTDTA